ncbi:MAG: hypothetical protein WAQ22_02745 [Candidatus Saccharimonas sp.]
MNRESMYDGMLTFQKKLNAKFQRQRLRRVLAVAFNVIWEKRSQKR